jgi:hypothetical protein
MIGIGLVDSGGVPGAKSAIMIKIRPSSLNLRL